MKYKTMTRSMRTSKRMCVLALGLSLVGVGCTVSQPAEQSNPLRIGIAYDVSGSVDQAGLSVLTMAQIDELIGVVQRHGGGLAFGLIDEKAFAPLERLDLIPVVGRLDERAQRNQINLKQIETFNANVGKKLHRKRDAKRTDVNGSIARLSLFFNEAEVSSKTDKYAMIISDGIDTGPWKNRAIQFAPDVKVLTIGMERTLADRVFGKNLLPFESIDAAIRYIKTPTQTGRK